MIEKLINFGFSTDTRLFRRTQAMSLLNTFMQNSNLRGQLGKKKVDVLVTSIVDAFNAYMTNPEQVKVRFLCELLNLTRSLLNISEAKLVTEKHREMIKTTLETLREKVPKNRHFQDVKKAFNKIAVVLQMKVITGSEKKR